MNCNAVKSLSFAAVCFSLMIPQFSHARTLNNPSSPGNAGDEYAGQSEAMKMVPAQAVLARDIDARKAKPGDQFRAKLYGKANLTNGTELPPGTELIGTVAADDARAGDIQLSLRFTKAELKGGKVVPIKATIVGVFPPATMDSAGSPVDPGDQAPNTWTDSTLKIDEIGALRGVDLHSAIASNDSGTLVTQTQKDLRVLAGSELALAIAAQQSSN